MRSSRRFSIGFLALILMGGVFSAIGCGGGAGSTQVVPQSVQDEEAVKRSVEAREKMLRDNRQSR